MRLKFLVSSTKSISDRLHAYSRITLAAILICNFLPISVARSQPITTSQSVPGETQLLPFEITPEGVSALSAAGTGFLLVDADVPIPQGAGTQGNVRRIYYSAGLSQRAARDIVARDRSQRTGSAVSGEAQSQRLTGTPIDWLRLGLKFNQSPILNRPIDIIPKSLSDAIKDGADLQIIDLRPVIAGVSSDAPSAFPHVLKLLPHQVDAELKKLSKLRWTVLVDDGSLVAQPIAEQMFRQGFLLIGILNGGYPAWVAETGR